MISSLFVFCFGTIAGWLVEFVWRSLVSERRLVNPGFLAGPYLPIYGFAALFLYYFSSLGIPLIPLVFLFMALTTLLELITGLFFLRYFNIRLWDYTDELLNYRGIVCPKYTIFWTVLALLFNLYIYPLLSYTGAAVSESVYPAFALGIFYGVIMHDVVVSFGLAIRVRGLIEDAVEREMQRIKRITDILTEVNLDRLKMDIRELAVNLRVSNSLGRFFRPLQGLRNNDLRALIEKNLGIVRNEIPFIHQYKSRARDRREGE